jgi:hypothetical protein
LRSDDLEVAVLERGPWRRGFRRVERDELTDLLAAGELLEPPTPPGDEEPPVNPDGTPGIEPSDKPESGPPSQ